MKLRSHDVQPDDRLVGLDFVRGVAAVTVLVYHVDFMFGLRHALLPGGYLAVDLFFALSGFVIAKTYERAIVEARVSGFEFAWRRLARLYPLFLLTTIIGLFVMVARFRENYGYFDDRHIAISAVSNLLLLPTPSPVYDDKALFPFNPASWSIFYELVVNAAFYVFFAGQRVSILAGAWAASGVALIVTAVAYGGVDVGWGTPNFVGGFARVFFSFLSGMLLWRLTVRRTFASPTWLLIALVAFLLVLMQMRLWVPNSFGAAVDLAIVVGLIPLLVVAGAGSQLSGRLSRLADSSVMHPIRFTFRKAR